MAVEVSEKWGFGMAPPKHHTNVVRHSACVTFLESIASTELPAADDELLERLSTVKGLFNRVAKQDQWDWFTVAGQLGHPSPRIARVIADEIYNFRSGIRDTDVDAFRKARSSLLRLPTKLCVSAFLGQLRIRNEPGAGWIYILSTREIRDLLKIGMTMRTVEERAREINAATGVAIPFGVRRCWRVLGPQRAESLVHDALAKFRIRNDREFFRVDFISAAKLVTELLGAAGLEIRTLQALGALTASPAR